MFGELPAESPIQHIVVVLGSENLHCGTLSPMATARCDRAIELCAELANPVLVTTGGFGHHFNPTDTPHADHLKRYLRDQLPADSPVPIFPFTACTNTVEDLDAFQREFSRLTHAFADVEAVHVVTSDFHSLRVMLILQSTLFAGIPAQLIEAKTPWDEVERVYGAGKREALFHHEYHARERLIAQGGILIDEVPYPLLLTCPVAPLSPVEVLSPRDLSIPSPDAPARTQGLSPNP